MNLVFLNELNFFLFWFFLFWTVFRHVMSNQEIISYSPKNIQIYCSFNTSDDIFAKLQQKQRWLTSETFFRLVRCANRTKIYRFVFAVFPARLQKRFFFNRFNILQKCVLYFLIYSYLSSAKQHIHYTK